MSTEELQFIKENFDEENIAEIRKALSLENLQDSPDRKIYTLVQENAPCNVRIKKSSRDKCVESLLK